MTEMWWADPDAATTDSRRLAALAAHGDGVVRDLAAEVVRLRAENETLRAKAAELQALIDAWAAAADWSWVPGDPTNALAAAEDALLAAATKEGDRG